MAKLTKFDAKTLGLRCNPTQHIPQIHTDDLTIASLAKLKVDVVSDQTITLNHEKALSYLDLPVFPGEREVTDNHVQFLYDEIRKGTFNPLLVILSTATFNGVEYKINGQHTCWAVVAMPPSFSLRVREINYRVATAEQLKLLYSTYDRLKARTDGHITKVFLADTEATRDLWMSEVPRLVSAFRHWHVSNAASRRVTPEQLSAVISREFSGLFRQVALFVQANHKMALSRRVPVVAAMFATFDKVPTKATEFWQPVIDGVNLSARSDPRWQLRDALLKALQPGSSTRGSKGMRVLTTEDVFRICLLAWNKWRKGESAAVALRTPQERPKLV